MRTPRKVFIKPLATSLGAAAFMLRGAAQGQETLCASRDPKLMARRNSRAWLAPVD